jgi:hypothetical protein
MSTRVYPSPPLAQLLRSRRWWSGTIHLLNDDILELPERKLFDREQPKKPDSNGKTS